MRQPGDEPDPGEGDEHPPGEAPPQQQQSQQHEDQCRSDWRSVVCVLPEPGVRSVEDQRPNGEHSEGNRYPPLLWYPNHKQTVSGLRSGSFRNTGPARRRISSLRYGVQETTSEPSLLRVRLSVAEALRAVCGASDSMTGRRNVGASRHIVVGAAHRLACRRAGNRSGRRRGERHGGGWSRRRPLNATATPARAKPTAVTITAAVPISPSYVTDCRRCHRVVAGQGQPGVRVLRKPFRVS